MSYVMDKKIRADEDAKFFKEMIGRTCNGWDCNNCQSIKSGCLICNIRNETRVYEEDCMIPFTDAQELHDFISWIMNVSELSPWQYCSDVDCEKCEWIKGVVIKESMVSSCPRTKLYHMFDEKV